MPGLLDKIFGTPDLLTSQRQGGILNNPLMQLGIRLMAHGGPASKPHSFGQDLAGSLDDLKASDEADSERQMKALQFQQAKDAALRRQKSQKAYDDWMETQGGLVGMLNGGGASAPSPQVPGGGVGEPVLQPQGFASSQPAAAGGPTATVSPLQTGLSPDYAARVGKFEGQDDYNNQSQNSSARGRYQFMPDTYAQYGQLAGVSPGDWSPGAQDRVFERFTKANQGALQMHGLPINDQTTYAMHLLGQGDGPKFVKAFVADPNTSLTDVLSQNVTAHNPAIFKDTKTVGEAMDRINSAVFSPQEAPQGGGSEAPTQASSPSAVETQGLLQGLPKDLARSIKLNAYLVSGGDGEKALQYMGQQAQAYTMKIAEEKARRKEQRTTFTAPFNVQTDHGTETWRQANTGDLENITERLGGTRAGVTFSGNADLDKLSPQMQETVKYAAEQYRKTRILPAARTGLQGLTLAMAARLAKQEGRSAIFDVATQMQVKADQNSLNAQTKLSDNVRQFEETMLRNMKVVEQTMDAGGIGDSMPFINRWVQYGKTQFGNEKVPAYTSALLTVLDEYAKILAGASGGAMTTDSARQQAVAMIDPSYTKEQVLGVFNNVIRPDAENRRQSVVDTREDILKRTLLKDQPETAPTGGGPTTKPAGKISKSGRPMHQNTQGQWEYDD